MAVGNLDGDGDMDLDEYADFSGCLLGPTGALDAGCECFDLDADGVVDLFEFAEVQLLFAGN